MFSFRFDFISERRSAQSCAICQFDKLWLIIECSGYIYRVYFIDIYRGGSEDSLAVSFVSLSILRLPFNSQFICLVLFILFWHPGNSLTGWHFPLSGLFVGSFSNFPHFSFALIYRALKCKIELLNSLANYLCFFPHSLVLGWHNFASFGAWVCHTAKSKCYLYVVRELPASTSGGCQGEWESHFIYPASRNFWKWFHPWNVVVIVTAVTEVFHNLCSF